MLKVAVIGLGKFGSSIALQLNRGGAEVLAIDRNPRLVDQIAEKVSLAVGFDATEIEQLSAYDIAHMDIVVVGIGTNFEASVLVTMHCKALGAAVVYAKALNEMQENVLLKVGADHVVKPEEDMGERLAEHLLHESVVDFVELPEGFSLRRIPVPRDWIDKSLAELNLLGKRHLNLVQIVRRGGDKTEKIPLPHGGTVLQEGDEVDLIGPDKKLGVLK